MNLKKYVSVGVCAVLALTSAFIGLEGKDVKVKKKGSAVKVESLQTVGEVLGSFSDGQLVNSAYRDLMHLSEGLDGEMQKNYKTATIHMEITQSNSGEIIDGSSASVSVWESCSLYMGEEAHYYIFEGVYSWYGFGNSVGKAEQIYYTTEVYSDEELSLIRISDFYRGEFLKSKEEKHKESCAVPAGMELNKWYRLEELSANGYQFQYSLGYEQLSAISGLILANKSNFEYLDKEDGINKGALAGGLYQYKPQNGEDAETQMEITVDLNDATTPKITYDYSVSYKQEISVNVTLDNINATFVKPLKKVKIAEVDEEALKAKEEK